MTTFKRIFLLPLAIVSAVLLMVGISYALSEFNPDNAPVGYVGMPAVTDNIIDPGPSTMFSIDYSTQDWTGNVHAYSLSTSGVISTTDNWSVSTTVGSVTTVTTGAAAKIAQQNWDTDRKIVTINGATKVPFRWASLSTAQQASLNSENILKYIRGDRSNEAPNGDGYRERRVVLGDVIHSTPLFWEDPATYSATGVKTASTQCSGEPCKTVFVGANDGMLHVLDANTGAERFAYIPSQLISKLATLSNVNYEHQYYVDGQLALQPYSVTVSGVTSKKVVLAGTLGGGGRGVYALDVSNPNPATETAASSNILWEISSATTGFSDLGYVYGKPVFTKAQDGQPMVLVGNGYNSTSTGQAVLYKINALTGVKIGEISTGSGSYSATSPSPNGLSTPTLVDVDLDGKADYAYAGDVDGHLWKFDLINNTATSLLTTDSNQAITMAPSVMPHPSGGYMVVFVTGKLFTADDQRDTATHYAYGVWDDALATTQSSKTVTVTQTLTEYTYGTGSTAVRVRTATNTEPNWTTAKGWKTALPKPGERLVGGDDALISQGVFRFFTSNPTINSTNAVPGENWWMELNPLTGGASGINRFDLNGDRVIGDGDLLTSTTVSVGTPALTDTDKLKAVGRHMGGGVRSQLLTLFANGYSVYHANYDRNGAPPSPAGKGVAGGHFDVEFYKAPATVCSGESAGGGSKGQGSVLFNYGTDKKATYLVLKVGSEVVFQGATLRRGSGRSPSSLVGFLDGVSSTNYTLSGSGSTVTIVANSTGAAYNGTVSVTLTSNGSTPGYVATNVTGGTDSSATVSDSTTQCSYTSHTHEYDDKFDKTGVNMLNPSISNIKLSNAITSASQEFKVLMMNQYLNPAAMLHIGNASYSPASATGYIYAKNYQTGATLDITTVPSYTLSTIGSLALNLPVDAFDVRDWWGSSGDSRNGLIPTSPQCVYYGTINSSGALSNNILADMYTPVVPPAASASGAATLATEATEANGARHGGAITVQIIKATTPQSAIEQNVAGRPEFGYRVKRADFYTYVLAEYTMFWHHPRRVCFHDSTTTWYNGSSGGNGFPTAASGAWNTAAKMVGTGWTKAAPEDTSEAAASSTPATGSTDPKLGSFGSIEGAIGSGTGSGGTSGGTSTDTLYNVVTGGQVVTGIAGGGAGGSGTTTGTGGAGAAPTMEDVFGLKGKAGRINWREIFK